MPVNQSAASNLVILEYPYLSHKSLTHGGGGRCISPHRALYCRGPYTVSHTQDGYITLSSNLEKVLHKKSL